MASSEAGTSSGSEYQVFLNFRGLDTRQGFTDILYHNLTDVGIRVFLDDEGLRVGERIDGSLLQAINNSRIYIPIFSRKYASSHWCLHELTQIVANTSKPEGSKEILPIFFDVEPNDIKLKTRLYRDAIKKLKRKKKLSNEQVNTWREALMEVDAIKGWEVKKYKGHGELIKLIVEVVLEKLKIKHRSVTEHLTGIDDRVVALSELLDVNSGGVRLIQIHGMGGIGKTTLTKVVFNKLSSHFGKCCCFLEDIREKSSRIDGLVELQKKLLFEVGVHAGIRSIDETDYGMKRTGEALSNKKVLIVLDDVDKREQVEKLVGKSTLYPGSRILITTRNKDVLPINTPNYNVLHYEMEVMSIDCALELFSRHAFNRVSPSNDYNDLSRKIVSTTGGLPLALEVIGLFLRHKTQELWIETLEKLSKAPNENVFEKLKISYDALTYEQQQIFLDIACFFVGEDKTNAFYMWKDCEFFPIGGVAVLINKSLVKIVDNKFWMHDQLRDLGRQIVHLEDQMNPERRSRIWICQEVLHAIGTKGNKDVGALYLDIDPLSFRNVVVKSEQIRRFKLLRFFSLTGGTFAGKLECHLSQLRWISWNYPRTIHRSTSMSLTNLVVLEFSGVDFLCSSGLQKIIKMARKLKVLYLKSCHEITETPDFSGWPDLERLTFIRCSKLKKIDGSIGKLKCLIDLKIDMCLGLEDLPEEIGDLVNLEHFFVCNCKVKKFPITIWRLKSIREVHFSSGCDN